MFENLKQINRRPAPFEFYTADALWTDRPGCIGQKG